MGVQEKLDSDISEKSRILNLNLVQGDTGGRLPWLG